MFMRRGVEMPNNEMIERVARALAIYVPEQVSAEAARAAIAAMREPSEALKVGYYKHGGIEGCAEYGMPRHHAEFVEIALAAMIDAALS